MRVLILAPQPFYQNRGTPIAVRLLAEVLGKNGHEVHLLVFHEGEDVAIDNVTLHRIPAIPGMSSIPPGFSIKKIFCDGLLWLKSLQLQWKYTFDIVHAVEEAVFIAQFNKIFFRVPYIYDMDSCLSDQLLAKLSWLKSLRRFFEWFEVRAVKGSAGVVAVCRALEVKVRTAVPDKILVRLEDISLLDESSTRTEPVEVFRESLGLSGKLVLYVGNLETYQGIDLLLEGFAQLPEQQSPSTLVIIGGSSGDIARYRSKCAEMGLAEKVFFVGPRPVHLLGRYLEQADVVVSPRTEGENTPMKIYSYLDSGRPVLATRIVSHTQVLDENIAFLADPDPESFSRGLHELLNNDEKALKLAAAAKKRVAERHSRTVFEKKLTEFYQLLVARTDGSKSSYPGP